MSQNNPTGGSTAGQGNRTATGGAGTGDTDAGTTRARTSGATGGAGSATGGGATGAGGGQGLATATSTGGGQATGAAAGLSSTAQEYGQKIADAASQAKDYVSDKVSVVGDKLKDLQNADFGEMANQAKDYARQKPGQALLISAAAGFVLGLLIRGSRR